MCDIVRPSAGGVSVFGHDHRSRQARRLLGPAAQEINVDRFLSIRQILVYHAGYHGIGRKAAARPRSNGSGSSARATSASAGPLPWSGVWLRR
ncbi:hypothetical protein [Streptomyces sp. IBSBF 2390]|uniref:hypothetical protein n=1 Tax=Streptomyces sp. IBSBF 2390 TaxID=2903533 RepID=UPI002FDC6E58